MSLYMVLFLVGTGSFLVWWGRVPSLPIDFVVFWAAAKLAVQGDWMAALDGQRLLGVHGAPTDDWFPWLYPPGFLLLVMPLGAVSFATTWVIFVCVSCAAMALAVRRFDGGVLPVWIAFAFAPSYLPALVLGRTCLL